VRVFLGRLCDFLILPAFLVCTSAGTYGVLRTKLPSWAVPFAVLTPAVAAIAFLERLRPERPQYRRLDQRLRNEVGHFLLGLEAGAYIGGAAAIVTASAVASLLRLPPETSVWPTAWPPGLQILLAVLLGEAVSYWQHRLAHRLHWLWGFHALHHSGERLNFVRAGRFHVVDIATAAFLTYVPMTVAGAPEFVLVWTAVLGSSLGLIQHANIRMRTPAWLDQVLCTPAVHRFHHSRVFRESDGNFGTTVMIFDLLFRSYVRPQGAGPEGVGIENDPVPRTFWRQIVMPFRMRS